MSNLHKEGTIVFWSWYGKKLRGIVQKVYYSPVTKQIKTAKINHFHLRDESLIIATRSRISS
ncbi:MAG: hypothetical protein RCO49_06730 [Rickettsia endosymbiont of Argas persicus]